MDLRSCSTNFSRPTYPPPPPPANPPSTEIQLDLDLSLSIAVDFSSTVSTSKISSVCIDQEYSISQNSLFILERIAFLLDHHFEAHFPAFNWALLYNFWRHNWPLGVVTKRILSLIIFYHLNLADYVMALEFREWATRRYTVKLVSQTITTTQPQICLQFRVLLNRANEFYTFLVTMVSLENPYPEKVVFQRYVAEARNFSSNWENVTTTVDTFMNQSILLLFEVIIPPGSNGFFAALDDIVVAEGECSTPQSTRMYIRSFYLTLPWKYSVICFLITYPNA